MSTTVAVNMQTMARSYQEILQGIGGTPWVPLGNFMLDFFRNFPEPEQRAGLLADPIILPQSEDQIDQNTETYKWALFCATSVRHLARRYNLACPQWALDPIYTTPLQEAWYFSPMSYQKEEIRQMEEDETPEEFAQVRIFSGEVYVDKYAKAQKFRERKQQLRKTA